MPPDTNSDSEHVTLAIIGVKLDTIEEMLRTHIANDRLVRDDHEERLRTIEHDKLPGLDGRISALEPVARSALRVFWIIVPILITVALAGIGYGIVQSGALAP
ncbi:MAG: hypothetical protein GF364_22665 [Candidatus Lokiarchaeota archaeon]|nr:hypothetical protein [Candidatus Lokiarchaeota archaeon]